MKKQSNPYITTNRIVGPSTFKLLWNYERLDLIEFNSRFQPMTNMSLKGVFGWEVCQVFF
jgi:hypothetical protein